MRRPFWILLVILAVGLALGIRAALPARHRWRPLELVLAPAQGWENMTAEQRKGFGVLFKDCLEYGAGLAVVEQSQSMVSAERRLDSLQLRVAREGDWIRIQLLRRQAGKQDVHLVVGAQTPQKAIGLALTGLGLDGEVAKLMIPRNPDTFWDLAQVADWRAENDLARAMLICDGLVEQDPECATTWLVKARIADLFLLTRAAVEPDTQAQCEGDFLRALELAPDFPRAVTSFARFKTDIGNQHGALELLFHAIQRYPRVPRLYEAMAYAARNAGLLDGALLSLRRRDQILGRSRGEAGLTENSYLYAGDLDSFEAVLGSGSEQDPDALRDFYRGYARLVRGDRAKAGSYFARAYRVPMGLPQFEVLAQVYHLGLQGRTPAALTLLRGLWAERVPMRVPDGEYTFKLAEAFGFLGSQGEAQEVATRAFAQGFGCLRWYRESPFLAGIRGTPRWNALQQHLQERQQLTERVFPASRFRF